MRSATRTKVQRAPQVGVTLNPVMTQVGLGLGVVVAGAMDRSITVTGARIRVTGTIRVRDTVKIIGLKSM